MPLLAITTKQDIIKAIREYVETWKGSDPDSPESIFHVQCLEKAIELIMNGADDVHEPVPSDDGRFVLMTTECFRNYHKVSGS